MGDSYVQPLRTIVCALTLNDCTTHTYDVQSGTGVVAESVPSSDRNCLRR
ncbi:MAG TPA: hypothetical protein VFE58_07430 [Tepidisphaeraceae bacterium]|nr:hypothetical protein [Tepidisphaeraceae bacterium]